MTDSDHLATLRKSLDSLESEIAVVHLQSDKVILSGHAEVLRNKIRIAEWEDKQRVVRSGGVT